MPVTVASTGPVRFSLPFPNASRLLHRLRIEPLYLPNRRRKRARHNAMAPAPKTKASAQRRRPFPTHDREPLKRSPPCPPWPVANLPANLPGRLKTDRDNVPWNALKDLPDSRVIEPVLNDLAFVSSCLVSLILVCWKENSGCFLHNHN